MTWFGYATETHKWKVQSLLYIVQWQLKFNLLNEGGQPTGHVYVCPSKTSWWCCLECLLKKKLKRTQKETFSGRRLKCCHAMMNNGNDGIFPRKWNYSRICPRKGQINYLQNLCENLNLIRNLRILFFLGKWHILKSSICQNLNEWLHLKCLKNVKMWRQYS